MIQTYLMALSRVYLAQSMPEQSNKNSLTLKNSKGEIAKLLQAQIEVALAQKDVVIESQNTVTTNTDIFTACLSITSSTSSAIKR